MAQLLRLPSGDWIKVERTFYDGGRPPRMGLMGGQTIQLDAGTPPMPLIHQAQGGFFYADMRPVNNADDVQHLPEPYRAQALVFIGQGSRAALKPVRVPKGKKQPPAPKAARRAPERVTDDESLKRVTGGVTVKVKDKE